MTRVGEEDMECVKILSYTIPMFGNRRSWLYGKLLVKHNSKEKVVRFGKTDEVGRNYITFNRKRYYFRNVGDLYSPKIVFEGEADY